MGDGSWWKTPSTESFYSLRQDFIEERKWKGKRAGSLNPPPFTPFLGSLKPVLLTHVFKCLLNI
jgi:hypothetical protein